MYMIDIERDGEGRKNFIAHLTHLTSHVTKHYALTSTVITHFHYLI